MIEFDGTEGMTDRAIENAKAAHEWVRSMTPRINPKRLARALWALGLSDEAMSDLEVQMEESVRLQLSGKLPDRMAALLECDQLPQSMWMLKVAILFNAIDLTEEEYEATLRKIAEFEKGRDAELGRLH